MEDKVAEELRIAMLLIVEMMDVLKERISEIEKRLEDLESTNRST